MAARVIHFGTDDCHRLMVLRTAGYDVDECNSLSQLRKTLRAMSETDIVCITEGSGVTPEAAGALARSHSTAPVVLFRSSQRGGEDGFFDLVVPTLTPPEIWLQEMRALITRGRTLRARSLMLIENSRELRRETALVREKSQTERARSNAEYMRTQGPFFGETSDTDPQPE